MIAVTDTQQANPAFGGNLATQVLFALTPAPPAMRTVFT
jgi:hypothetical protein